MTGWNFYYNQRILSITYQKALNWLMMAVYRKVIPIIPKLHWMTSSSTTKIQPSILKKYHQDFHSLVTFVKSHLYQKHHTENTNLFITANIILNWGRDDPNGKHFLSVVTDWTSIVNDISTTRSHIYYIIYSQMCWYIPVRIPTVKLKIPGKLFLKVESRTSVTFKL